MKLKVFNGDKIQFFTNDGDLTENKEDGMEVHDVCPIQEIEDLVYNRFNKLKESDEHPKDGKWFLNWALFPKVCIIIHFKDKDKFDWNNYYYKEIYYPEYIGDEDEKELDERIKSYFV